MKPKVSIVIPVYNGEQFVEECIDSILSQSFPNFEVIIVNDNSTDNTFEKLLEAQNKDERIKIISNVSHNMVDALNIALDASNGIYIARIDIDDKMSSNRLSEQVKFMDEHNDIVVCSSWARCFGESSEHIQGYSGIIENPLALFLTGNFIIHPSVMLRKSFLTKNKIKYKYYPYAEDYKLWIDIAKYGGKFGILPLELIQYRISKFQISNKYRHIQYQTASIIKNELLEFLIKENFFPDDTIIRVINNLAEYNKKGYIHESTIYSMCAEILLSYHQTTSI